MTIASLPNRLLDPEFHASGSPHEVWQWMRQNEPIYWHAPSNLPAFWSFTRYEDIRSIYGNPSLFSSAQGVLLRPIQCGDDPGGGLTLALTDPPRHKWLRTVMSRWFTMSYARSLENRIRHKIQNLLAESTQKVQFDFSHDIASRLTLYVTCHVLGVPEQDHEDIFHWTHEAFEAGKPLAAHHQFMLYFGDLMERRMTEPADDLASALIHGAVGERFLAEDEILLNFENLIGATENAGLSMASGILSFLNHPESLQMLSENRALLSPAIEEVLRFASSATHSMRVVTRSTELNGHKFEAGDRMVLWLPSANRDDAVFKNPYKFDITRHPNRHLALGYGEHFCIGNALARIQMRALLSELLDMDYTLELSGEPIGLHSIHVNGPIILPVHFKQKVQKAKRKNLIVESSL